MIRLVIERRNIKESYGTPCEGIFWYIDGNLVVFTTPYNRPYNFEHKTMWREIKGRYSNNVPFDYYPRGRVMVNADKDSEGNLIGYKAYIYIDNCINTEEILYEIKCEFRLTGDNCKIMYCGADGGITSNHYQCHDCKG
jgi:hypothetical protein